MNYLKYYLIIFGYDAMFDKLIKIGKNIVNTFDPLKIGSLGIKGIKHFIDDKFRAKVIPVEGSVLYSDLYIGAEHSGIYIGNNEVSNIVVDGFAESVVKKSSPDEFTDKSILNRRIYVSCDANGAVGNGTVSSGAISHLGERGFYGLIFSNCHEFSEKCVNYSRENHMLETFFQLKDIDETWEPTIKSLKNSAKKRLGATKWRLWDWQNEDDKENVEEPNEHKIQEFWKNMQLNEENIKIIRDELTKSKEYIDEVADENLPEKALELLNNYKLLISSIDDKYEEVKGFIRITGCGYSYNEIMSMGEDFSKLAEEMKNNTKIKEIIEKLGRAYISEEKKLRPKVIKRMNNEILGVHKSNDLVRLLPSELVNFESEDLEYLFYSKFLENNLLTYEIVSKDHKYNSKQTEEYIELENRKKGPVVACLDTSGSMHGMPILKAKALLLATCKILEKEDRSLYILLFGGVGEIRELNINKGQDIDKVIPFLNSGFGGGTDFETPIKKGIEIINKHEDYNKADILMITDGLCSLNNEFIEKLNKDKQRMDFSVYTIICNGSGGKDRFSDEIIVIQ